MFDKVKAILDDYIGEDRGITPETNLSTDLGLNSFDVMSLACEFEDAFELEIPTEQIEKLTTVQSLMDYITGALATA